MPRNPSKRDGPAPDPGIRAQAQATRQTPPSLLLDVLLVAFAVAMLIWIWRSGLQSGHELKKGTGAILLGLYLIYDGVLFLLSYFFPRACYVFTFMTYLSTNWSNPP